MEFVRKHKKISIAILCVLILFLMVIAVFGRYIRNIINNYILETKAFYFKSDYLKINGKNYYMSNWDGVKTYKVTIDLKNYKSKDEIYTTTDIAYDIEVDCPSSIQCTLNKTSGVIHPEDQDDSYEISFTPVDSFEADDKVTFTTRVISSVPYRKELSATYTVSVETKSFSYNIEDAPGEKFLTINFTNSVTFYEVRTAFGEYAEGDHIGVEEYAQLSEENRAKCFSANVTVEFDPHDLFVDMTNKYFLARLSDSYEETNINGYNWVKKFKFEMPPASSSSIMFYKNDITKDYTYPLVNSTSIITVTPEVAN